MADGEDAVGKVQNTNSTGPVHTGPGELDKGDRQLDGYFPEESQRKPVNINI